MPAARSAAAFVHLPCDMGKKCHEFCPRGSPTLARRATSREDYQVVAREACLLLPKGLAHQPFNAVTIHCSTRNLSADDDADARPGQCVGSHEHTEVAAYYRRSARGNAAARGEFRHPTVRAPWRGGPGSHRGHRACASVLGNHACAYGAFSMVDTSASYSIIRR
jgi:hypothetical protein